MALNLLDSLSSTAATPEKNSFSFKTKESPDGASADFAQLLGGLMNPSQAKGQIATDGTPTTELNAEVVTGQKVATEAKDPLNPDGSAALLAMIAPAQPQQTPGSISLTPNLVPNSPPSPQNPLAATVPAQLQQTTIPSPLTGKEASTTGTQNLTALVLSPNMTAITPSQPAPDSGSLVAFAKSQGLDEEVAAWLFTAGKGTATSKAGPANQPETWAQVGAAAEPPGLDAQALTNAAVAISLMATPAQAAVKPTVASSPAEATPSPIQLMPMATPAAWLTTRQAATGKAASAAPTLTQAVSDKNPAHSSDLDLSLIFGNGKDPVKSVQTPEASFTPAAWVMAGVTGNAAQSSSLLTDASLVKSLLNDKQADDGSAQVDGLNTVNAERSPGKLSEPLGSTATGSAKAAESSMSTAERSELHQAQAEKMGQAIGQRMLSEMEKGHWHLKMMLKPANLGNVEVEMRLRNGELDANFTASQSATRDLLQDGLPKLRETLTQMGMDVASMNIDGGSSQKNGGDSTPQQQKRLDTSEKTSPQEEPTTARSPQVASPNQDGLDVMV